MAEQDIEHADSKIFIGWLLAIGIVGVFLFGLVNYGYLLDRNVKACHDAINDRAKHVPEVQSTRGAFTAQIEGEVNLQNGFGAWTIYEYECTGDGELVRLREPSSFRR